MLFKLSAALLLSLGLSAVAQDDTSAPVVENNGSPVLYEAILLEKDNTTVSGSVTISTPFDGSCGLRVQVSIAGIPEGEALNYHIHKEPVPEDGNCYLTSGHLDPYGRGDTPACDISHPETCEVGDLSGKHGPAFAPLGNTFTASYPEFFLSQTEGEPAYFGDLSVVVHARDKTRLTCGNFKKLF